MNLGSFKNDINKMRLQIIYSIYMYKEDLELNNLQCLIRHKTELNQNQTWFVIYIANTMTWKNWQMFIS